MMRGKSPLLQIFAAYIIFWDPYLGPAEGRSGSEIRLRGAKTSLDNFL